MPETPRPFRLETPRLVLRSWQDADRDPFWAMCQDEEVMQFLPRVDRAGADAMIDRMHAMEAEHGHCFWAVEAKDGGAKDGDAFVGIIGMAPARPPLTEYEIGWRLTRAAWGHGYAQEAARATLDWAWAHREMATIVAITVPANVASQQVMARIGMHPCPDETFEHPSLPEGDPLRTHVLYRIARPNP